VTRSDDTAQHDGRDGDPGFLTVSNLLSLTRIPLGITFLAIETPGTLALVVAAGALTDLLDGFIARVTRTRTEIGALLDPFCDRVFVFLGLVSFLPGGLLVTTNVASSNPCRYGMDFLLEWHLIQRDKAQLEALCPDVAPPGSFCMTSELTGVNVFIEVRKPYVE